MTGTKCATVFDKTSTYNKNIRKKIEELINLCGEERMPCFVSVCIANNEDETTYEHSAIIPASYEITLKDNKISKYLALKNGCTVAPPSEPEELDLDTMLD